MPFACLHVQDNGPVLNASLLGPSYDSPNRLYKADGNATELCYVNGISMTYKYVAEALLSCGHISALVTCCCTLQWCWM